jgi:hypothetical protein
MIDDHCTAGRMLWLETWQGASSREYQSDTNLGIFSTGWKGGCWGSQQPPRQDHVERFSKSFVPDTRRKPGNDLENRCTASWQGFSGRMNDPSPSPTKLKQD